ncbi:hypothetical protein [Bradyrhizobium diazoefficiens]|uniref:Phospholipase D-like domain-containing protein n=1 Tax=Bradyrhizobium diazoefficiens TaxID=1355477 RepID=A0A809Y7D6_9BRAD|nr:hypothetical protein [Bradyrhizobium diazoefficiens]BBZ99845.1 hypothetical protein H12S4_07500 [Bradyrhizobium diazoefficiens]BCA17530.1 hypothetical protein BDHH15_07450 [Bradyrhizobium diazoefficiens]BCE35714.1 hypothetical protein XF3B_07450 [Bradyrhizobium diazoefficiens]BCF49107.1 hypothetical protein XF17B_07450 [Bradyrhizobium diazoefficiens]
MKVLYSSNELHDAIATVLSDPKPGDRRIALVAYVGGRAEAFLPDPAGLDIVCWLKSGSTDPLTLARLRERGAKLFKSDLLHMKVYWSSRNGCVICSANASGSALGSASQKEAGVYLPAGSVNIDRLWSYAKPAKIKEGDLRLLNRQADREPSSFRSSAPVDNADFLEWKKFRLSEWSLGWWYEDAELARKSKAVAKERFGIKKPVDFLNLRKGQLRSYDWALSFRLPHVTDVNWFYTDFVHPIDSADKLAFDSDNPFQAVQARPLRDCPRPPFKVDRRFRSALRRAIASYGPERIENKKSLRPTEEFIDLIAQELSI